ncbi:MAG: HNH endonuclease signature motif containing protein [Pseudomonadota bacterium]
MLDPATAAPGTTPAQSLAEAQAQALHTRLQALVRLERRAVREIALALAEIQQGRHYRALGYAGLTEYGEQAFGFCSGKTRQLARLGRLLPDLPALDAALCSGALGWTKARTLAQVATPVTEAAWVARALQVDSRELEELACRACAGEAPPDGAEDWEPPRWVWARFRLDPLHFERLMQALAQARHHLGDLDLSASQLLLWLAERWLEGVEEGDGAEPAAAPEPETTHVCRAPAFDPDSHPIPHRVVVHRCPACERAWSEGRAGRVELHEPDRVRIECDAEQVAGDLDPAGGPPRAGAPGEPGPGAPGRLTRSIPPALRRAVLVRDGGRCQVPGCRHHRHVELHHLVPRTAGGMHTADNLVTLCSCHHDLLHRGVLRLSRDPGGGLRWERGGGEPLGVEVSIHGDRAELGHGDLCAFEGPPGSWPCLDGYWGGLAPEPGPILAQAPHGRQEIRLGDEQRPAPAWMMRSVGC